MGGLELLTFVHAVVVSPPTYRAAWKVLEPQVTGGRGFLASYRQLATTHYLPVSACQSAVLRGGSDVAHQLMEHTLDIDIGHALAMGSIGLCISGLCGSLWLQHLERRLGCSSVGGFRTVLAKSAADYTCWAPVANSAYLLGVPALTTGDVGAALASMDTSLPSAMGLELLIFVPYNLIAFSLVPPALRPSVQAVLACVFTVGLSTLC